MNLFQLTFKSLLSRKLVSILLILSIGLSTMLLIGVQKIKHSAKESFSQSISGTDLIVGARSGEIQLLLYTVFRQGKATANMSWESINTIQSFQNVRWVVPVSLGDSHRGYPVLGTSSDYFRYFRYAKKKHIEFDKGRRFKRTFELVLGSEIATKLNYKIGDSLYLSHGMAKGRLSTHKENAFRIVGILKKTGTPIDKTLHIPLEGFTSLHLSNKEIKQASKLIPKSVTGCFVGLDSKFSLFSVQKRISDIKNDALMAIIPGVALSRLWNSISTVDTAFLIITVLVVVITLIGLLLALFLSLQQRQRELAILRTMGAHPLQLSILLVIESLIITISGVLFGALLIFFASFFLTPLLEDKMGLILSLRTITFTEIYLALGIVVCSVFTSLIPALMVYRKGQNEGFLSL